MSIIFASFITSIPEYINLAVEKNSTIAYLTICLAMLLENIIPPIPSEIIMPLGGFFVYQQKLNFYILVFWGLLGTILGSLPWYYLGRLVNEKRLSNFLDKKGKYLGISSNDLLKSKKWFERYGISLVFWGRLIPGVRTLISIPAGIELMPLKKFLIWTSLGSLIWVALLSYAGYLFGENYQIIETYVDQIKYFVKPVLIFIFLYFFIKLIIRFIKKIRS
ncbi:alkaline phosphatase [Prochlorococcus marinus str. MU1404]|uniref:DedA family protein n=1 Tax=Prochlorococcus marinus TaxID=1219 RepID=UPI001ADCD10F|nr:DedA family protein [Prochlorococcus marinus]MBO8230924.1 DedA family protein [Prochlorococcus marinus XMU1404]MBW3073956.1 alkaline phosphatase [Prochlorococcus marinus str. MU1404]MCR8544744.1 DedA family protein [Prochlorococcus marinus CUG1432]